MHWKRWYVHIVPVRFRPNTITFMGMVRTEGRVSTRRGFCGFCLRDMLAGVSLKLLCGVVWCC